MITIINAAGGSSRTSKVEFCNIETHMRAHDALATEAEILKAYDFDDSLSDRNPIAYNIGAKKFLFDESEVEAVESEDPSSVVRVEVIWME